MIKHPRDYVSENLYGLADFLDSDIYTFYCGVVEKMMIDFGKSLAQEALKNASDNAMVTDGESSAHIMGDSMEDRESSYYVDKQSILDEGNIPCVES